MSTVWANRLVAGDKTWDKVPASRKDDVKAILEEWVESGRISNEKYKNIVGEI